MNLFKYCWAIPVAILGLYGCKDTNNGGTILLKGQMLYDCSRKPHANEMIRVKMLCSLGVNNNRTFDNVGTGYTDAQGNFAITCENHGQVEQLFLNDRAIISFIRGGDGQSFDIGEIYDHATASALFKITFDRPRNDTFYMGSGGVVEASVYPASGTRYIRLQDSGALTGMWHGKNSWKYGYGKADFRSADNFKEMVDRQGAFKICTSPDTTSLTLY